MRSTLGVPVSRQSSLLRADAVAPPASGVAGGSRASGPVTPLGNALFGFHLCTGPDRQTVVNQS